jgi:hypothetical protein
MRVWDYEGMAFASLAFMVGGRVTGMSQGTRQFHTLFGKGIWVREISGGHRHHDGYRVLCFICDMALSITCSKEGFGSSIVSFMVEIHDGHGLYVLCFSTEGHWTYLYLYDVHKGKRFFFLELRFVC